MRAASRLHDMESSGNPDEVFFSALPRLCGSCRNRLILLSGFSGVRLAPSAFTLATDDHWRERLAVETDESRDEESRLKASCSQDWLPHKSARPFAT